VPYIDATLIKDSAIEASGTVLSDILEVYQYSKKTIYVKANKNVVVEVKLGVDDSNMCFLMSGTNVQTEDESRQWNCNTTSICFPIYEHAVYMQVVITNTEGSAGTVSVWMSGE
jgi:hypothetical protein